MHRQHLAFQARHLVFLFSIMFFVVSCGYSLEFKRIADKVEDPITMVRRELRQLKADHRVAIFDLQKEQKTQIESIGKMKRDLLEARTRLGQNNADTDERFAEMEIQHRLIHGRIEEEGNRFKESSARGSDFTLKVLEGFRTDLAAQKGLLSGFKEKQVQASQVLQEQISGVQAKNVGIEQARDDQTKTLQAVSGQVSELIDKMLPAVNGLVSRVDNLEWELEQLKTNVDIQGLQGRLTALREAVDIQRQSLEMLGNTLAAQVDKQGALLQKTVQDLKGLQSKTSSTSKSP